MKRTQHNSSGMILACGIALAAPAAICSAQSLLREQPKEAPLDENGEPDQNKPIREMSPDFANDHQGQRRTLSVLQTQAGYKTAVDAVQPKPQKLLATREASI